MDRPAPAAVRRLHTDWRGLAAALLWHGAAWVLGAFEIMGVLGLLGHPVSLADALVIESLAQALRNVGFMLPGALAVQEGAIVGAAALVGVPPAAALAAALVRRTREVRSACRAGGLAPIRNWRNAGAAPKGTMDDEAGDPECSICCGWSRSGGPAICNVSVTNVCNATCDFCNFAHDKGFVTASQLAGRATASRRRWPCCASGPGCASLTFMGGEPLLHPRIVEMARTATDMGVQPTLVTNGWLLPGKLDALAATGITTLFISIDAADAGGAREEPRPEGRLRAHPRRQRPCGASAASRPSPRWR